MELPNLTPKQMEVLKIIGKWFNTYKKSPTLRQIAAERNTGKQVRSVVQLLTYLENKRVIARRGKKGITVLQAGERLLAASEENQWM